MSAKEQANEAKIEQTGGRIADQTMPKTTAKQSGQGALQGVRPAGKGIALAPKHRGRIPFKPDGLCRLVVDKVFGKRHWAHQWALDLCRYDRAFMQHLTEQPAGYAHFLCLLNLALPSPDAGGESAQDYARAMRQYAETIRANSKKKLLKARLPACPPAILKTLAKLPKKPMRKEDYRQLVIAFGDKNKRKHFAHAKRVRKFDIQLLDMMLILPAKFHAGMAHCDDVDDYEQLCMLVECAKRLNIKVTEREFSMISKEVEDMYGLWRWLVRQALKMPFPPPPWEGNDKIRPLCSRRELAEAGEQFKNCAATYAFKVLAGHSYLYVCEQTPAMIEIVKDSFFGWMVEEIQKPNRENRRRKSISRLEMFAIKRAFHQAGICQVEMDIHAIGALGAEERRRRHRRHRRPNIDDF